MSMTETPNPHAAALARLRKVHRGGRVPSCTCGKCDRCKQRKRMAEYRAKIAARHA